MKHEIRMSDREVLDALWARVKALFGSIIVPTKVSDLDNDEGFLTQESDPTVPAWAKAVSKPSYTAQEVGALPDTTAIPTKTSDLTNDSGYITASQIPGPDMSEAEGVLDVAHGGTGSWNPRVGLDNLGATRRVILTSADASSAASLLSKMISETWGRPTVLAVSFDSQIMRYFTDGQINKSFTGLVRMEEILYPTQGQMIGTFDFTGIAGSYPGDMVCGYTQITNDSRTSPPTTTVYCSYNQAATSSGGGGGGGGEANVINAISLNGVNVPPDANKRVSLTETDPTVPAWAKASSKPSYTASEVGAVSTSDVIDIAHGGTGATTAAVTITNDYSSILNVINAVKNTRIFPISIQKNQGSSYSDMPSGMETQEWNLLLIGDKDRLSAMLYIYNIASNPIYVRQFVSDHWLYNWVQIN